MAIINKGKSFANGEQLTADKLNQVIDNATFASGAVDNVSTQLSGGAIIVKDGGVATAKLNDNAVTTAKIADANVTFAKLTDVIDDDTMATASSTTLATSESIKAYVDSNGITQTEGSAPYFGVRAWAYYHGTNGSLINSGNIASVTKHGTGDYEFFFDVPMTDANYAISLASSNEANVYHGVGFVIAHSDSSCRVQFYNPANSTQTTDKAYVAISIIQ